jgi:hypothetical protein
MAPSDTSGPKPRWLAAHSRLAAQFAAQADAVQPFHDCAVGHAEVRQAGIDIKESFRLPTSRLSVHRRRRLTVIVWAAHARGGELIQLGLEPVERPIDTLGHLSDYLPGLLVIPLD